MYFVKIYVGNILHCTFTLTDVELIVTFWGRGQCAGYEPKPVVVLGESLVGNSEILG